MPDVGGKRCPDKGYAISGRRALDRIVVKMRDRTWNKTYASNMTPIRRLKAVPYRPMHQVHNGEIKNADRKIVSKNNQTQSWDWRTYGYGKATNEGEAKRRRALEVTGPQVVGKEDSI